MYIRIRAIRFGAIRRFGTTSFGSILLSTQEIKTTYRITKVYSCNPKIQQLCKKHRRYLLIARLLRSNAKGETSSLTLAQKERWQNKVKLGGIYFLDKLLELVSLIS